MAVRHPNCGVVEQTWSVSSVGRRGNTAGGAADAAEDAKWS